MEDSTFNSWKKIRIEFKREIIEICKADSSLLLDKQSEVYKRFEKYCLNRLIHSGDLSPAEFYTFVVFIKFESLKEAAKNYSEFSQRSIQGSVLQKKARQVKNKILERFKSSPNLMNDMKEIFGYETY